MTDAKSEKENRDPAKKRSIIRGIVIVFLVILLILTFFSNTIMNKSLAQVTTSAVTSGKLTERIRGNGTVEPQQSYEVTVSESATIDTIMVKKGQEIKKGDVLFTVVGSTSDELSNAQEKLRNAELNYQQELLNQKNADEQQNDEIKKAQTELNEAIEKRDEAASNESYNNELKNAKANSESALTYQKNIQTNLSSTISAIDMDDYSMAAPEYTGDINLLKSRAEDAERVYEMALNANSEDVAEKEAAMNEAKNNYEEAKQSLREKLTSQLADVEYEISRLENEINSYEINESVEKVSELDKQVSEKQKALEEIIEKNQSKNESNKTVNDLKLENAKAELDEAQKKLDEAKEKANSNDIVSKYNGIVGDINTKTGSKVNEGDTVMSIDITDEGYLVKIKVEGEKAKKAQKGAEVDILNNFNNDIQAELTNIKNDTVAGSKNMILEFNITGNVNVGANLELSIPCGSGNYDAIVPKSAVYEDKKGNSFVLVTKSKSSPLGNRYYAEKVEVEVVASDETSRAVRGGISAGDYVITAASKPVSPKDQVRMKDN
ncbi:MAG: HlyD family efflux transporter periplasmic adaptor subunit [Ruminococcus sp.]|nr:HlyD family efflux transporter periplasmic adaptor subunit [Ruminococcus sp.]